MENKQSKGLSFKKTNSSNGKLGQTGQLFGLQQDTINSSYLYTPTQYLISNFLTTKKTIQDDLIGTLKGITEMRSKQQLSTQELKQQLSLKKKQLQGIKRKLNQSCQEQMKVYDVMKKRINRHQISNVNTHKEHTSIKKKENYQTIQGNNHVNSDIISSNAKETKQQQNIQNTLFDLNLNKQIGFFMLQQSVKREETLRNQKAKQIQQKKKLQEQNDENRREQNNKEQKIQQQDVVNEKNDKNAILFRQQNVQNFFLQPDQPQFFFNQPNQQQPDINTYMDDIFELERFFQSQDIDLGSVNFVRHMQRNKDKQIHASSKVKIKTPLIEQQKFTQKDLFVQSQFIKSIAIQNQPMDIEIVDGLVQKNQNSYINHQTLQKPYNQLNFQGEIQLECFLYRKQNQISQDILSNQLDSVNRFLYENSHMIKKYNSNLQFWVTLCSAVELIKTSSDENILKCIESVRNRVSRMKEQIQDWHKQQLYKFTSMLLFPQVTIEIHPYLKKIQEAFRQVFQQIYRLPDFDKFIHSLYTGALILKTPTCIEKDKENPLICPLCNPLSEEVFKSIPLLTKNQSSLICRINGSVMDHENYPIMLPSNQIYSLKGLEQTKRSIRLSNGKMVEQYNCKFTQTWYSKDQAKKVFLA